ncbi:hypothetical protein [Burkholderia pseudomallei]|uniref:hypothetical protein n=1 Tax=Burkholderia pseudomallei TaxID=28450 RepID=UPI00050FBB65|nr:hypothetical protein [Burkholderia pseudomallei]KGC52442.1 urocanate hydratase domain protein [Burkholderia pseudomallei]
MLDAKNIAAAGELINGVGDAYERAKVAGLGLEGSKFAKKVFPALAEELGIDGEKLRDRLTSAWLAENGVDAGRLVEAIKASLNGG